MNFGRPAAGRAYAEAVIDIAPLVDCVFLLLIFFLLTSTFATSAGIEVDVPTASPASGQQVQNDLVVAIPAGRAGVVFQHREISDGELEATLSELGGDGGRRTVIVQADRSVEHGRVVRVMDAIKRAGFTRLAIGVRQE